MMTGCLEMIYKTKTGIIKPFTIDSLARFDSVRFMCYLPHTRGSKS